MAAEAAQILSTPVVIEIMDGVACAFMAAAAACRARSFGGNLAGALALGCICGMSAPLMRETFLHGQAGSLMVVGAMPDDAFIGAICGALAPLLWKKQKTAIFFCLDSFGMGLASALASILALAETGVIGALAIGLACALLPGLIRDVALGDMAMFVERNWYAAAAGLGCVAAIGVLILIPICAPEGLLASRGAEIAVIAGLFTTLIFRFWKDRGAAVEDA